MASIKLPDKLPLLVIDGVLFPGASIRIPVTKCKNLNIVKNHLLDHNSINNAIIGVVPKESNQNLEDDLSGMHTIGTAGIVIQITGNSWPQPSYTILVTGLCRFKLEKIVEKTPYLIGQVFQLDRIPGEESNAKESDDVQITELMEDFKKQITKLIDMLDLTGASIRLLNSLPLQSLPDVCAAIVKASHSERLEVLDAVDLTERVRKTLPLLIRQIEGLQLLQKAKKEKDPTFTLQLSKFQPKIKRKLDFCDDHEDGEINSLEKKIMDAGMSESAKEIVLRELKKLKKIPPHSPDHFQTRSYIEVMLDLPWNKTSPELLDLKKSQEDLDEDHYGMVKLKQRVLEYLAVRQMKNSLKGPILCFVGPPGVGKTSIGRSIARSLGRQFHRVSLGGTCDPSDIRGHRRTYVGSMPGRIIQGLKATKVKNPVLLLDEIDKMGKGYHGNPAAALLEVLDPEQNCAFTDHYINAPFDLSQVLFIATANTIKTIPAALLDRMEIIHVPGYTHDEKEYIAINHLIPKLLNSHGLTSDMVTISQSAVRKIILNYTMESGVRNLERKIGAVCRAVALKWVKKSQSEETLSCFTVNEKNLETILGTPIYIRDIYTRLKQPGVAIGMVWSIVGGKILFVEASKMDGDGQLVLTGQLGDVMKESAKIALALVRANGAKYGVQTENMLEGIDVHIHFPAGAVSKDGPSAGITIATVLVSLFTGQIVCPDLSMTGEITLQGLVLPVGGIKEKVLAAKNSGIKQIILPKQNEKDLKELGTEIQESVKFHLVSHFDEVVKIAFSHKYNEDESSQSHSPEPIQSKL